MEWFMSLLLEIRHTLRLRIYARYGTNYWSK
jgi:hypothetical protein